MEFVRIPTGTFNMGSPSSEEGRDDNEGPVHEVRITKPFYMGKYEVTQAQWKAVMGTTVSQQRDSRRGALQFCFLADRWKGKSLCDVVLRQLS